MGRIKDYYEQEIAEMRQKQALESTHTSDETATTITEKASQNRARDVKTGGTVTAKCSRKSIFPFSAELLRALIEPQKTPNPPTPDVDGIDAEDPLADATIIRPAKRIDQDDSKTDEAQQ